MASNADNRYFLIEPVICRCHHRRIHCLRVSPGTLTRNDCSQSSWSCKLLTRGPYDSHCHHAIIVTSCRGSGTAIKLSYKSSQLIQQAATSESSRFDRKN